jgi:hypothetical protein
MRFGSFEILYERRSLIDLGLPVPGDGTLDFRGRGSLVAN